MARFEKFEDIIAWQRARDLTANIYRVTEENAFSKDFALKDQVRRASVSVMANIAEGFGRKSNSEFANFLNIARGSANELQSLLYVAVDLRYISPEEFGDLYSVLGEISKMTLSLAKFLRSA